MNILPYKISILFHYECPKCKNEIICSIEQNKNGEAIYCSCGYSFVVNKIKELDVDPIFENNIQYKERKINRKNNSVGFLDPVITEKKKKDGEFLEFAMSGLVNLGYKKIEAKKIVLKFLEVYKIENSFDNEFVVLLGTLK